MSNSPESPTPLRPDSFQAFSVSLNLPEVQEAAALAGLTDQPLSQIESIINQTFTEAERGARAMVDDRELYLSERRAQLSSRLLEKEGELAELGSAKVDCEEQWSRAEAARRMAESRLEYELAAAGAEMREKDALATREFWEQLRGAPQMSPTTAPAGGQQGLPSLEELGQATYPTGGRTMPEIPLAIRVAAHDIRELTKQQTRIDEFLGDRFAKGLTEPTLRLRIAVGYLIIAAISVALTPLWDTIKPKAFLEQLLANIAKALEGAPGWWILAGGLVGVPMVITLAFLMREVLLRGWAWWQSPGKSGRARDGGGKNAGNEPKRGTVRATVREWKRTIESIRTQDVLASLPYLAGLGLFIAAMIAFKSKGEAGPYKDFSRFSFGAAYALATLLVWKWRLVEQKKGTEAEQRDSRWSIAVFLLLPTVLGVGLAIRGYLPTADPPATAAVIENTRLPVAPAEPTPAEKRQGAVGLVVCSLIGSALLYALRIPAEALLVRSSVLQRERLDEEIHSRFRRVLRQTAELQAGLLPAIEVLRRSNGAAGNELAVLNGIVSRLGTAEGRSAFWRLWDEDGRGSSRSDESAPQLDGVGSIELQQIRRLLWSMPVERRESIQALFLALRNSESELGQLERQKEAATVAFVERTKEVRSLHHAIVRSARRSLVLRRRHQAWLTRHRSTQQWLLIQARLAYAVAIRSNGESGPPALRMFKGGGA